MKQENAMPARTGGRILVDQLRIQGVDHVSCVPGESYLAVLDALHDSGIDTLVCRNEGGAGMMAEAYGKLTGRPGICFVTRGPGATNASPALHVAMQDSTPMILFVGQVESGMRGREAFQELDYRESFRGLAKWACEIDDPARIPELVARAFRMALQGRPGPVVLALPEDMLVREARVPDAPMVHAARPAPTASDMAQLHALLKTARRPVIIVGGSGWRADSVAQLQDFALRWQIPVLTSYRRSGQFPATHPMYAGELALRPDPALVDMLQASDLVLLLDGRLSEVPSGGYTLLDIPAPRQALVHVHPDPAELGRVYQPQLAINAHVGTWCTAALALPPPAATAWQPHAQAMRRAYEAWTADPPALPGRFQYGEAVRWLRQRLPADAIVCHGAGNYTIWLQRWLAVQQHGTQLGPTSGTMGYGVPAAVMAQRLHPGRQVVAFAGDGCFLMNGQEFATAVQYALPIVVIVVDNGMYGTIRMHQERHYPGRVFATGLRNPDFAALARAYGGHGEHVSCTEEFAPAFERAVASGKPSILHCLLDARALTPTLALAATA